MASPAQLDEAWFHNYVQTQLQAYLEDLEAAGPPYVQDPADWATMAVAIGAAAESVFYDQGAPRPVQGGVDEGVTLATQVEQSPLVAGVPEAVDQHLSAALVAGGVVAAAALLTTTAPTWAPLIAVVAANVFLWAVAAGAAAYAVSRGLRRKTWLSRDDSRTRPSHAVADGQTVPALSPFTVGGFNLRWPHDPFGPPQETYNCRCTVRYS